MLVVFCLCWQGCATRTRTLRIEATPLAEPSSQPHPMALDHFIRASILDQQGEITKAIGEYRRALQYDSAASTIYLALAEDYLMLQLYDDAMLQLVAGFQIDSTHVEIQELLCDLLLQFGNADSAQYFAERLVQMKPEEAQYLANLAEIQMKQGKTQEAILNFKKILGNHPSDMNTLGQLSALYIASKNYQSALDYSLMMHNLDPENDRICYTLAALLDELGRTAEAEDFYLKATTLNPNDPQYFINWAFLHINKNDHQRAIEILESAVKYHPNTVQIWSLLGNSYHQIEQDDSAIEILLHAISLDSTQVSPYVTLGIIYDTRNEFEKAEETYRKAIQLDPENALLLNNYAYLLAQRKVRLNEALEMVERALEKTPDSPYYLDTIGWIHFGMGDYTKAREFLEKALELDEPNAELLSHLGDVLYALGDVETARQYWLRALELDPENTNIREKLAQ
ncbi:MAG: tetratricopeptide repeat protein [bacterium]